MVERLAAEIDLDAATHDVDVLLARLDPAQWHPQARREVLVNYIGFPFWDVLTFSVTSWRDLGEFDEIRIDRISPEDASTLRRGATAGTLKGTAFLHFGAFFSRAFRENDYLWGRLHAVDRLIDIVCDSAGPDAIAELDVPGSEASSLRAGVECRGEAPAARAFVDRRSAGRVDAHGNGPELGSNSSATGGCHALSPRSQPPAGRSICTWLGRATYALSIPNHRRWDT